MPGMVDVGGTTETGAAGAGAAGLPDEGRGPNADFARLNDGLPPEARRLIDAGRLGEAARMLRGMLDDGSRPALAASMRAHLAQLERLPREFCVGRAQAVERVRAEWPGFGEADLDALVAAGRIDWRLVDGEQRFLEDFVDSLRMYPADAPGLAPGGGAGGPGDDPRDAIVEEMRANGGAARRITVRASLAAKEPPAPGADVQAWLPLPAACPQQSEARVLSATEGGVAAPEDAPQRTMHWAGRGIGRVEAVYRYVHRARFTDAYGAPGAPQAPLPAGAERFLSERPPHIAFTPYLRRLADEVTAGASTRLERARAVYDYVTLNVDYRYQPAYLVLDCIPDMCAKSLRGDCGVMALLFITLCRIAGVPARWQSGLYVAPGHAGSHDWAMFYAEPYGWLYADCSFGSGARRMGKEARRRHYFGNLDPWRMAANSEVFAPLSPPDPALRDDPFDNQRGEMCVDGRGLASWEMDRPVEVVEMEEA